MTEFQPYRHQKIAIDFCMEHERAGLFLGMGLGKTVITLTVLARRLWDEFTVRKCLVIAPKNVAQNVWAQECLKWTHTKDIRCSVVLGSEKQRLAALEADADLYIINRENVVWLVERLGKAWPYDMVVLDELSSFKSHQAKRWKALKRVIGKSRFVLGLTGTPAPNGYLDLWPQVYLLDNGERLERHIGEYRSRYFTAGAHRGNVVFEYRLRMGAQDAINRKLKDLCLSMSAEDWLSLPPILYNEIPVSMDAKARKLYDRFKDEYVIPLLQEDGSTTVLDVSDASRMTSVISAPTAANVAGKLLQMANGAVYDDSGGVLHIHDAKLDALEELVEANAGENLLVFYSYQHDLERILERFPKARKFSGPQDQIDWNNSKIPLLLCHAASTGHGLNLQHGGHIIVWFGLPWSLELYQQANARLPRPGQKQSVMIHHLVCRGTYDEKVVAVLNKKDVGQRSLLDALKEYVNE